MGKYQGYEKYKDSGVEWLGEIPEHWEAKRLKFISKKIQTGTTPPTNNEEYYQNGNIDWFAPSDFLDNQVYLKKAKKKLNEKVLNDGIVKKILKGSILVIGIGATLGKVGLLDTDATSNQQINAILLDSKHSSSFVAYFLLVSQEIMKVISNATTLGILNQDKTKQIPLAVPPLEEQNAIAQFLDHKTSQIDALISKKEALLEKLDEKRTALISHAVTKGLDPTVPMKDSGIEWLGDIPAHWEVMPVKRKAQVRGGVAKGRKLDKEETVELPYLRVANVQDGHIDISDIAYIEVLQDEVERYLLRDGDVLMNEGGDNDKLGRGAVWKAPIDPCLHQNHVFAVRPHDLNLSSWIALLTLSSYAKFYFFSKAKQSTNLASISSTNIRFFPVLIPPKMEIKQITQYISKSTARIDEQKAKIKQAIDLLKEYRTALITNAVTGKIDVRQVPIPQP